MSWMQGTSERHLDHCIASHSIKILQRLADQQDREPFFLTVGFLSPHLPWASTRSFFDALGPAEAFDVAPNPHFFKKESQKLTKYIQRELEGYVGFGGKCSLARPCNRRKQSYYSAVSLLDEQVGRLIDALDASPASDNTLVVFWGDNGWHLGEQGVWGKKTLLESATRVPFAVIPPSHFARLHPRISVNGRVASPTESVDIYPTVVDLAGLARFRPKVPFSAGISLRPLLFNTKTAVRAAALTQYKAQRPSLGKTVIGYALRTKHHRLIVYLKRKLKKNIGSVRRDPRDSTSYNYQRRVGIAELYRYTSEAMNETTNIYNAATSAHARAALMELWKIELQSLMKVSRTNRTHLLNKLPFDL